VKDFMSSIGQWIGAASDELRHALGLGKEKLFQEANLLCQHALGVNRAWLITHENDELSECQQAHIESMLKRRLSGEPIAYILGMREFYGLPLKTTPATLIPRPDTETLVESALAKLPQDKALKVLDLGTGTGAVALAISQNRPNAQVTAVDFSAEALSVAKENAKNLGLARVRLMQSDWFSSLRGEKFDVIVSNPPYIAENDAHLKQGDLRFEPITALASGEDGLNDIRHIIQESPHYLSPHGWLMLEHGYDQAEKVAELLKQHRFSQVGHASDLSGILRVTLAQCLSQV
jgi:release factor glutamine methyltransferase